MATLPDVTTGDVADIPAAVCCRWKVENQTFDRLEKHGHDLEPGRRGSAITLVMINLQAFALHTVLD